MDSRCLTIGAANEIAFMGPSRLPTPVVAETWGGASGSVVVSECKNMGEDANRVTGTLDPAARDDHHFYREISGKCATGKLTERAMKHIVPAFSCSLSAVTASLSPVIVTRGRSVTFVNSPAPSAWVRIFPSAWSS